MLQKYKDKREEGFTIIEVLIVLAIAGLIILIVFLAVPALQRNNRNTQRRNDVSRVLGLVSEYSTNNNGALPTDVLCTGGDNAAMLDLRQTDFSAYECTDINIAAAPGSPTEDDDTDAVTIYVGSSCNGAEVTGGAAGRAYVAGFGIEGSAGAVAQCQQS